jgi:hypothetical protein
MEYGARQPRVRLLRRESWRWPSDNVSGRRMLSSVGNAGPWRQIEYGLRVSRRRILSGGGDVGSWRRTEHGLRVGGVAEQRLTAHRRILSGVGSVGSCRQTEHGLRVGGVVD